MIGLDDPFGSLITDIQGDDFKKLGYALGDKVTVKIDSKAYALPYVKTFMDVPVGEPLLYIDSRGRLGVALNQRDFSKSLQSYAAGFRLHSARRREKRSQKI